MDSSRDYCFATGETFAELLKPQGVPKSVCSTIFTDLCSLYAQEHRAYHNRTHIEHMLGQYRRFEVSNPSVELAIWFHDAIYDPRSKTNEVDSADYFGDVLNNHLSEILLTDVKRLISATDPGHPRSGDPYEDLLIDIDLSILGAGEDAYERYSAAIRQEYDFVPWNDFAMGRTSVLERFLQQPIYATAQFEHLDEKARANIRREIEFLSKRH